MAVGMDDGWIVGWGGGGLELPGRCSVGGGRDSRLYGARERNDLKRGLTAGCVCACEEPNVGSEVDETNVHEASVQRLAAWDGAFESDII